MFGFLLLLLLLLLLLVLLLGKWGEAPCCAMFAMLEEQELPSVLEEMEEEDEL